MAVQRLTLNQIITMILHLSGYAASTDAPWGSDANLRIKINAVGQNILTKVGILLQAGNKPVLVPFWKTTADSATSGTGLVIAAGSSTGYLPIDYYHYESFYDLTNEEKIEVIDNPLLHHKQIEYLKKQPAGPPKAVELLDWVTYTSNWQRKFTIYPSTVSTVTPSVNLVYYRLPAAMPGDDGDAEYPDAPPQYHILWAYGGAMEVMASDDPTYERIKGSHDELIAAIAAQSTVAGNG